MSGEEDGFKIDDVNDMELDSDEEVGLDVDEAEEGDDLQSLRSIYHNIEGGSESDDDERRQSFEASEQRIESEMQEEFEHDEPAPEKRRILLSKRFIDGAHSLGLTNLFNREYERD